jgi:hypothetical protein
VKVGDLVSVPAPNEGDPDWVGVILAILAQRVGWGPRAVVYWNAEFPKEEEYQEHLEVINESG